MFAHRERTACYWRDLRSNQGSPKRPDSSALNSSSSPVANKVMSVPITLLWGGVEVGAARVLFRSYRAARNGRSRQSL